MAVRHLEVTLGWYMDAGGLPDPSAAASASIGKINTGPLGLLSLLETHLGVGGPEVPEPVRIAAYLRRLKAAGVDGRFYTASFQADAWSTSKTLLRWRDDLALGGWDGCVDADAPIRLRRIGDLERIDEAPVPAGPGERLARLLARLNGRRLSQLRSITLVDRRVLWPHLWNRLFDSLAAAGVLIQELSVTPTAIAGNLAAVQHFLRTGLPGDLAEDDSIVALDAESEIDAAEVVADWLAADPGANAGVVVIRGAGSALLDGNLRARHLPSIGLSGRSPWRSALQVLPLVFEVHWEPFNPASALELLSLPKSPLSGPAASAFARALQEHPGRDGPAWENARREALEAKRARLNAKGGSAEDTDREVGRFDADLDFWLAARRYRPEEGIPLARAIEICDRVARWTAARHAAGDADELLLVAGGQATTLAKVLRYCDLKAVTRPVLNRMLDAVIGDGVGIPANESQAAPWCVVDDPGQIFGPVPTIVWWGFSSRDSSGPTPPWNSEERAWLIGRGVHLDEMRIRRRRELEAYRRAVTLTGERLVLVMPRSLAGEPAEPHPLWSEIRAALKIRSTHSAIVKPVSSVHGAPEIELAGRVIRRVEIVPIALPKPRRNWNLPPGAVTQRQRDWPTSVERLLGCSLAWVLEHQAGIAPSPFLSLPDLGVTIGNLCHRIIERLFTEHPTCSPAEARHRAGTLYDELVPQMAATLLHPGREVERLRNREAMMRSAERLVAQIRAAGLDVEGVERTVTRPLGDGLPELTGKIDLLLRDSGGRRYIVDLKWSQTLTYRREQLSDGKPVQLAAYSWLVQGDDGPWPGAGFYMLRQARLLFSVPEPFADAYVPGTDLPGVWREAKRSYASAILALGNGRAIATGVPPSDVDAGDALPLALDPPCRICEYQTLCRADAIEHQ